MSKRATSTSIADLDILSASFRRHLRAANRSPRTITAYLEAVSHLDAFLLERGMPRDVGAIHREHVEAFIEDQLDRWRATTALARFKSLQQFWRWLVEEGEILESPMARMKPPKVDQLPPDVLRPEDVKKLLASCSRQTFEDRRDAAIITVLYDTGLRVSELVNLKLTSTEVEGSDVDLDRQIVFVMGKGRKLRGVPIGARSVKALDRYVRMRSAHPFEASPYFWLGRAGKLTQSGVQGLLRRRAAQAGLPSINPHRFRHSFASAWLEAGGAETDLMMLAGWQSRSMIERYGAATRAERARGAHRKLSPADRL